MTTAYRASTFTDFSGTPTTGTVSKPAGTVDGDLLTAMCVGNWDGSNGVANAGVYLSGWKDVTTNADSAGGPTNIGFGTVRLSVLYRTASSEGSSWNFGLNIMKNGFVLVAAWDGSKLQAGTPSGTYAASNGTQDVSAPYQAGFIPTQINKPPGTWSLIFSHTYDSVSSGGIISFAALTNETITASHSLNDTGTNYFIGSIYEKFDSKWEADAAGVGMSCNEGPTTFANGLWIPNYSAAAPSGAIDYWG